MTQRMTADEAVTFNHKSVQSMARIEQAINDRARSGCSCTPYEMVYSFQRWKALGYHVRKGERRLTYSVAWLKDPETGKAKPIFTNLFCLCQVDETNN